MAVTGTNSILVRVLSGLEAAPCSHTAGRTGGKDVGVVVGVGVSSPVTHLYSH